jgi:hypothetical protein
MQIDGKKMKMTFKKDNSKVELKAIQDGELKFINCHELYKNWTQGGQLMLLHLTTTDKKKKGKDFLIAYLFIKILSF